MDALATDLYELNMAASYLRHGMHEPATFSLFVSGAVTSGSGSPANTTRPRTPPTRRR